MTSGLASYEKEVTQSWASALVRERILWPLAPGGLRGLLPRLPELYQLLGRDEKAHVFSLRSLTHPDHQEPDPTRTLVGLLYIRGRYGS